MLIQWRSAGKTPIFDLEVFRQQLGVEVNQYKTMSNFKSYVLDFAIKQVNELTDITAKYEQHKTGRIISGFSFKLSQKKTKSLKTKVELLKLTDAQRHLFANKLSEHPEVSSKYSQGTESYPEFAVRLAEMLKDSEKLKEFTPLLEKLGFNAV